MRDSDRKLYVAGLADAYVKRKIGRRDFMRNAAKLGLGLGAFGLGMSRPFGGHFMPVANAQDLRPDPEVLAWVKEVSKPYAGTTLKFATESTPPSNALNGQLKQYFEEASGMKVEIEVLPLEQVLQKMTLDIASQLGSYDLYYIDQSWAAFTAQDVFDPREQYEANPDLAMPNWNMDDFLPALVDGISKYEDRWVGVPYDIPIFIMMYRKDIYDKMGFAGPPATLDEYLQQAQAIREEMGPDLYGATGQMKSGHYSLECDWTAWLWGHGSSIFGADGKFSGNDAEGLAAMAYWDELYKTMPPGVTGWTWDGQGQSIAQGVAATMMSWGEFFPSFDDPSASKVSGLMEAARCPAPKALRMPGDAGFGEIPGVGHQGGSSLAVSRNAKSPDAAWIFMQWATSYDTQVLITTLGGGTGPTRKSVYDDPRVKANNRVGPGTTRHLDVVRATIENDMGSEPDLPQWAELSSDTIPVRLGKYFAGEYGSAKEALDDIKQAVDGIVAG